jgi:hypothetical protein
MNTPNRRSDFLLLKLPLVILFLIYGLLFFIDLEEVFAVDMLDPRFLPRIGKFLFCASFAIPIAVGVYHLSKGKF